MRRFLLMIDQEPQGKNIRPADAIAFQQAVLKRLEEFGRSPYTGPVFLQLEFFSKSKTPPAIYNLPKNYLDLLEKPRHGSGIARKRLLFRNDRQVKALVVRYHVRSMFGEPKIWVRAEPFRDFLADVDLVGCVESNDFEDGGDWGQYSELDDFRKGPFHSDNDGDEGFERLAEFESKKALFLRSLGNGGYEALRHMTRLSAQQENLRRTDRFICRGVLNVFRDGLRTKEMPQGNEMAHLAAITRDMSLGDPFVLELYHAPHREGDSDAFQLALRSALEAFKAKRRFLFPLLSPMNVTILMVPPEGGGKDLDNLARLILPALHEIWAPPSDISHAFDLDSMKDRGALGRGEAILANLPKEPKRSITEYRVFELPRSPDDPKDGFVRLAVGEGMKSVQFREEIDDYLERWGDSLKN